jgi:ABC-type cobalamin/Fe3+-siderophores transport system ATPase subunit
VFELAKCLGKKTQEVSKGELQRTILAFSLLYGSRLLLMDEPIFALEPYQKEKVMDFMVSYAREKDLSIYYSVHELDLSEKYSDHLMIFNKDTRLRPLIGPTQELFQRDIIERAYEVPFLMLKNREALFREHMIRTRGMPGQTA